MAASDPDRLKAEMERRVARMARRERSRQSILAQLGGLGILGLLFVIPVVAGVYLGNWIDAKFPGYSVGWTISLMLLGIVIGMVNVYRYLRR
jgi:ATP synthase protein I